MISMYVEEIDCALLLRILYYTRFLLRTVCAVIK